MLAQHIVRGWKIDGQRGPAKDPFGFAAPKEERLVGVTRLVPLRDDRAVTRKAFGKVAVQPARID